MTDHDRIVAEARAARPDLGTTEAALVARIQEIERRSGAVRAVLGAVVESLGVAA